MTQMLQKDYILDRKEKTKQRKGAFGGLRGQQQ